MPCEIKERKIEDKENDYVNFKFLESIIMNVLTDKNLIIVDKTSSTKDIVNEILYSTLRKTDTYKNCIEDYLEFIYSYASFLNTLGINEADTIAIAYKKMLDAGYLSYNKKHKYDSRFHNIYKKKLSYAEFMELDELEGCYIATGSSICRHMSSFLTDLEGRVGNNSYNSYVTVINNKKGKNSFDAANHQITIIKDNGLYYGFCPVSGYFIELTDLEYDSINNPIIIGKSVDLKSGKRDNYSYLIKLEEYLNIESNPNYSYINLFNKDNIVHYKQINTSELQDKDKYVSEILIKRNGDLESFYEENKERLESISNSINTMIPRKKVKQMIIK